MKKKSQPAPITTDETLKELKRKQPVKRKRVEPVANRQRVSIYDLPRLAQQELPEHWDPRVTLYVDDPRKLKEIVNEDGYTKQNPNVSPWRPGGWFAVGGLWIREVGSIPDEKTTMPRRVVEVVENEPQEIKAAKAQLAEAKRKAAEAKLDQE